MNMRVPEPVVVMVVSVMTVVMVMVMVMGVVVMRMVCGGVIVVRRTGCAVIGMVVAAGGGGRILFQVYRSAIASFTVRGILRMRVVMRRAGGMVRVRC